MSRRYLFFAVALGLGLGLGACLEPDPEHCANRGGSRACEESGLGEHCSLCQEDNWGCRDQPDPEPRCRVDLNAPQDSEGETDGDDS